MDEVNRGGPAGIEVMAGLRAGQGFRPNERPAAGGVDKPPQLGRDACLNALECQAQLTYLFFVFMPLVAMVAQAVAQGTCLDCQKGQGQEEGPPAARGQDGLEDQRRGSV